MKTELRRLSPNEGQDIYEMLQEIPVEENRYGNKINGASYEEYILTL